MAAAGGGCILPWKYFSLHRLIIGSKPAVAEFIVQYVCMWSQISILPNWGEKASVVEQARFVWLCRKQHEELWNSPLGQDKGIHYHIVWHKSTSDPASFWPSMLCAKRLWKECRKHAIQALKAIGPPELELHLSSLIVARDLPWSLRESVYTDTM